MTSLRAFLVALSVLASLIFLPAPASAATVTISNTYPGSFAGNCGDDGTWGFYITMVGGAVTAPAEIEAGKADGGALTIPWTRTDKGMAFYETATESKLTGEATTRIDEVWKALNGSFLLGWGPCAATAMAVSTTARLVNRGDIVRFTGRLTGAEGRGLPDRTTSVRLHSIDGGGQGTELGPLRTDAEGRFTLDVKAESYGPIRLTGEYNGSFPVHGAEHGSTETATVWSLPDAPVTAHAALASSAGTAFGGSRRKTTVSGGGFEPNAEIGILLYSSPRLLGTLLADDTGSFVGEVTLPDGVSGQHRLVAAGIDAGHEKIRYLELAVTIDGDGLPVTGAPIWILASYAALLVVLGLFAVVSGRRKAQK